MYQEYTNIETGEIEYRFIQDEPVKVEKLSKNQKRKLRKGYYSKEHQEKMLSLLIHGKHFQAKSNNKNGLVRGQLSYMRKSILSVPVDVLADRIRQDEKEGLFTLRLLTSQLIRVTLKNKEKKVTRETEHFQE